MIEIVFITLVQRIMHWGLSPIIATRRVAADMPALRRLLSDPAGQSRLASAAGARRASVLVRPSTSERVVTSELRIGRRTFAWLTWILSADRGTTEVDLALQLESRGIGARLFLALGGRRMITRRVDAALAALAAAAAHVAEHPPEPERPARVKRLGSWLSSATTH